MSIGRPATCSVLTSAAPAYRLQHGLYLRGDAHKRVEVVAENLDADIAAHARNQFIEPQLDRLREFVVAAGYFLGGLLDFGDQRWPWTFSDQAIARAA